MISQFIENTLDLVLALAARLGLLRGSPEWYKMRLRERFKRAGRSAENTRRTVGATHRMCKECGTLVPSRESSCPRCGSSMGGIPRGGAGRAVRMFAPSLGSVSMSLVGVMAAIYLAASIISPDLREGAVFNPSGQMLWNLGAMVLQPLLTDGQWWRLVNPIFLHGGLLHVGFNCYVIANIGPLIETSIGPRKFFVLFIFTGVASFVVSALGALFLSSHWSVGASGSVFGLLGFGMVAGFRRGHGVLRAAAPNLLFWVLINFVIGMGVSHIDNSAHIGGLLAGGLLGLFFQDELIHSGRAERFWTFAAVICLLLPVFGFVMALWNS